ncbi:MAG TPA: hypothetical protein VFN37_13150 [Candidatus Baltobacteraceae bacterium]|nr:hypothetical protein [Candidatus Baltobacteraceae bacterium]
MTRTSLVFAVTLATLAAFSLSSSNGIALSGPVSLSNLAPADEYFGRQKLSPISIRHMVYSLKDELYHARRRSDAIEHDAGIVDDALQDWSSRFPRDSWLPSTFWNLAQLYASLPGVDARTRALGILQQLRDRFPETPYAAGAAREMPASLVRAVDAVSGSPPSEQSAAALTLEDRFFTLSGGGSDPAYVRAAWELASTFERLPGEPAQTQAIRLLALLVDRYPTVVFGKWAMRDLKRGVGER